MLRECRDVHLCRFSNNFNHPVSQFAAKEFKEAFDVISIEPEKDMTVNEDKKWKSAVCLLKGQIYEALDNRSAAVDCFKAALKSNVYCYEAFQSLTQHQMLTSQEGNCSCCRNVMYESKHHHFIFIGLVEEALLEELTYDEECVPNSSCYLKFLYESLLKKVCTRVLMSISHSHILATCSTVSLQR